MRQTVSGAPRLRGAIVVPADKSISHRAVILGALASGESRVANFLGAADCLSTLRCIIALGVEVELDLDSLLRVRGRGLSWLREPSDVLDCGNSGTTMRLMSGLLSGRPFRSILTGDASLRSRPMMRVVEPLNSMGAEIHAHSTGTAPLTVNGGNLHGISYASPIASAQVKSALLLAGLEAEGDTRIAEPQRSRDHTERMLSAMGAQVIIGPDNSVTITGSDSPMLEPLSMTVARDISSAAPWMVAAACHKDADLTITGVGVNETRTGIIEILGAMGARVELMSQRGEGGEPVADIRVSSSSLQATDVGSSSIPRAIDELPLVALAATQAEGRTTVRGAAELRVKESDRLAGTAAILGAMGASIEVTNDGWVIDGPTPLSGASVTAGSDHRMAFLAAIAGLVATGETMVEGAETAAISYPGFWGEIDALASGAPQSAAR
ncbi:MAG: 3-phosphoshikimate 1-carboxyvinyltransferase [Dehalococcoidia bacterium]|nr:3-phosphoshikimate 1-carboxyvinyltransferase [Dehalococcoidia bacterium]